MSAHHAVLQAYKHAHLVPHSGLKPSACLLAFVGPAAITRPLVMIEYDFLVQAPADPPSGKDLGYFAAMPAARVSIFLPGVCRKPGARAVAGRLKKSITGWAQ